MAGLRLHGQTTPVIATDGILNAASYTNPHFPGGSIAQGSLFTIFGSNLGPATPVSANAFPLGATLGGVSIQVTQGSTSVAALPFYVSPTQVSAIMPSKAIKGINTLTLTFNGLTSAPATVIVVGSSVGLFSVNSVGTGPAVLQNFVSATQVPVNSRSGSAVPGQTLILYGTGLGAALNADSDPPTAGNLPVTTEIYVGGKLAPLAYSGRSPCCSGLDQFVLVVPPDVPLGCNVPLLVRTAGTVTSNVSTIAISASGGPCSDAIAPLGNVTGAGAFATILLMRDSLPSPLGDLSTDVLRASFRKEVGGDYAFNPVYSLPPAGACTAFTAKGNLFGSGELPGFAPTGGVLDAGTLTVSNGSSKATAALGNHQYFAFLGATAALPGTLPTSFLDGGTFSVGGSGGKDVGAFNTSVPAGPTIAWTNRDQTTTVTRSSGVTVNWTFSGSGSTNLAGQMVLVGGGTYDSLTDTTAVFFCTAKAADLHLTVPDYILGRIPATTPSATGTASVLMVGTLPAAAPATFNASGIDQGTVSTATVSARFVVFQ